MTLVDWYNVPEMLIKKSHMTLIDWYNVPEILIKQSHMTLIDWYNVPEMLIKQVIYMHFITLWSSPSTLQDAGEYGRTGLNCVAKELRSSTLTLYHLRKTAKRSINHVLKYNA